MAQESSENFYDVLIKELRSEISSEIRAEIYAEMTNSKNPEAMKTRMQQSYVRAYVRDTESSLLTELGPKFFKAQKKTCYPASPRPQNSPKDSQPEARSKPHNRRSRELNTEESVHLQMLINLGAQLSNPFSESELKKEFRRLAQKFHPDHQLSANEIQLAQTQLKFTSLKNCYDTLKKAF